MHDTAAAPESRSRRFERRHRSQEAVERQRESRRARKARSKRRRENEAKLVEAQERIAVGKLLAKRAAKHLYIHPIQNSYLYWSLRRFGYDVLLPDFRRVWVNRTSDRCGHAELVAPQDCQSFRWWFGLRPTQRRVLTAQMRPISVEATRLTPGISDALVEDLRNPRIQVADGDARPEWQDPNQWGR